MVQFTNKDIKKFFDKFPDEWEMYVEPINNTTAEVGLVLPDYIFFTYPVFVPVMGEIKYLVIPAITNLVTILKDNPPKLGWIKPRELVTTADVIHINDALSSLLDFDNHNIVERETGLDPGSYD